jgi:hypothetical protein
MSLVLVAHACNPCYSRGRDQEDCCTKAAQANSLGAPTSKIPNTQRAGGVAQGVGSEFKPQYHKKIAIIIIIKLSFPHFAFLTEITLGCKPPAVFVNLKYWLLG